MANWTLISLMRGIRTMRWPHGGELPPGAVPLRYHGLATELVRGESGARRDDRIWTVQTPTSRGPLPARFRHSVHVRFVDAGANGALISEVRLLNAPLYNMHRFGIFITATPRNADVLLVGGPVTEAMRGPLLKAYEAMPEPKRVVAIGDDAIDGGVFGKSFTSAGGVAQVIPVDFVVPGCPPPPIAIIHGLLAAAGQVTALVPDSDPMNLAVATLATTHPLEEKP